MSDVWKWHAKRAPIHDPNTAIWQRNAACRGTPIDWWFGTDTQGPALRAVEVCAGCPVANECALDAVRTGERHGIRAGNYYNTAQRRWTPYTVARRPGRPRTL